MLNFELDEEQRMLKEAMDRFAREDMRKVFRDADEEGHVPDETVRAGWEFGLLPSGIPESYGGFGEYSVLTGAVAMEALAYGDLAITLQIAAPGLVALPIQLDGTDEQKRTYLPRFCEEKPPRVSAALSEPRVQFDPFAQQTVAVRQNGSYRISGYKGLVPLAESAEMLLVYAQQEGQTQAFIVPTETAGVQVEDREKLMGVRALPTFRVRLDDVQIPAENRVGGEQGIQFARILNHSRVALGAAAVGLARAGSEYARLYAKERVQFGEPIAHRQSIAFMLAEMAIDVDAARLMVWETAWKLDRGEDTTREARVMKHFVDEMVMQVADRTVQTLGGYGYVREFPAELWLRNARGFSSFDGLAII
ncbi:MAG: acyl-CoA dehydrogenase family protein [Candidatus Promineifilaceae bacterium]|nr:acyl-CoA dehydrogenase family protein [Candidatus Promineifilaceae bacterium]